MRHNQLLGSGRHRMSSLVLLIAVLAAWILLLIAGLSTKAIEDTRRGIPEGERHGVSIVPIIPIVPMTLWGFAMLVDLVWNPWGTRVVGMAHAVMAIISA